MFPLIYPLFLPLVLFRCTDRSINVSHKGFKIPRLSGRASSSLASGTIQLTISYTSVTLLMMNFFLKREFVIKELNTAPVAPFVVTVLSTRGGVTKSTNAANISAFVPITA